MEFQQLILQRQSDRKYLPRPVEESKLLQCCEAARLAPSACNGQPWSLILITDKDQVKATAECVATTGMNKFALQAPAFAAIVLEKTNLTSRLGSVIKDKEFPLLDIGISAAQFCLQAAAIGLGSCMLGWFNEKKLKKVLNVPKNKRIPLIISVGYSDSQQRTKIRKPMEKILHRNTYEHRNFIAPPSKIRCKTA